VFNQVAAGTAGSNLCEHYQIL